MKLPLEIVFRGMTRSEAIEASIQGHVGRLEKFHDRVMSCRVMVEQSHRHHHHGNLYHVRVDLKMPGRELVVSREPGAHHEHEDINVTIRDAFDAARRRLEDHARRSRGDVKSHAPRGQIAGA
jgi:ribosome-associated translation inhibitor RaiA